MDWAPIGRLSPVDQSDQTFDRFSLHGREDRAVDVEGDPDARMAKAFLDDLGVHART